MTQGSNLLIIKAFDSKVNAPWRQMAKLLSSSLLRTFFTGNIVILRDTPQPLYLLAREGLHEIFVGERETVEKEQTQDEKQAALAAWSRRWLWQLPQWIGVAEFDRVFMMEADCLALRNLDHLLEGNSWEVRYQPIAGNVLKAKDLLLPDDQELPHREVAHEGFWAMRGSRVTEILGRWKKLAESPTYRAAKQPERLAWNRLLLELGNQAQRFEAHEIQFAPVVQQDWRIYRQAALVHASGLEPRHKVDFLYGMWQQRFFCDAPLTLLHLLET